MAFLFILDFFCIIFIINQFKMAFADPNSATTLSLKYKPGQDKRVLASNSESIFTFGDFQIQRNYDYDYLTADTKHLSFDGFATLESLQGKKFIADTTTDYIRENELHLPKKDPKSHAYFSSFYTEVATAINNIIENYPYAIMSYNNGSSSIFDYSENYDNTTHKSYSYFKMPLSALTNQGNVILNSGETNGDISLAYNYDEFAVQLSGDSVVHTINNYSFSGTYLYIEIDGFLLNSSSTTGATPVYIRPTKERLSDYNKNASSLEQQLIGDGILLVPDVESALGISYEQAFPWPKTIDGFSIDSYGTTFDNYKEAILNAAEKIDEEKTNIFLKTIVPENYMEFDSDNQIFATIIQTYAHEFDKIKKYIDAIVYAHSIGYSEDESVPDKFMFKLSNMMGWKLSNSFSELSMLEYLTTDLDDAENSYTYYNLQIWRRILTNLVWLYKKKGTRDAITFVFKLLGAPDNLVTFNEFVYNINRKQQTNASIVNQKSNIIPSAE